MSFRGRAALLGVWIALLALLALYAQRELQISGDLRLFMPAPSSAPEKLLLQGIGDSRASRLLLVALHGAAPDTLAQSSLDLAAALREDATFRFVANGEARLEAIPEELLPYRYLLSHTLDHARFDSAYLRKELIARQQDLSSPAAGLLEPWIPRDPTLETLQLLEAWQPAREPQLLYDAWFSSKGDTALLIVETAAAAFDPEGQRVAATTLQQHFASTRADPGVQMIVSGPGAFAVMMQERTQSEAQWLGAIATAGMIALLFIAYRSVPLMLFGALPLLSAAIAGLVAVSAAFGSVHGITLAFGFTLIGVAQDYPIHLFSHQHAGVAPLQTARSVWPTLATGVASTCIAYLAFLRSGVTGLAQLGCFTITGLVVAGLTTRYLLPRLLTPGDRDYGTSRALSRLWSSIAGLPRPMWLGVAIIVACIVALIFVPGPFWQNDLGRLTPVPQPLLRQDAALRAELGAPDVRYLLAIEGESADEVLTLQEQLTPKLDALAEQGAIASYDHAARYLPSAHTQQERRDALPEPQALRAALQAALAGLAFRDDLFEPFLAEVERARQLPPITQAALAGTPLELQVSGLLMERAGRWTGLVTFSGVNNPGALAQLTEGSADKAVLLDLKQASEDLVARQRQHILWSLGIAAVLLTGVVYLAMRSAARALRVLLPMAMTTVMILAVLHTAGVPLTLFHLIALVLAAGLGLDYALFFERAADDTAEQGRTLHAILVCAASTLMVFALLACSTLPVLRAIGVTVSLGVIGNFILALLLTRPAQEPACSTVKPSPQ